MNKLASVGGIEVRIALEALSSIAREPGIKGLALLRCGSLEYFKIFFTQLIEAEPFGNLKEAGEVYVVPIKLLAYEALAKAASICDLFIRYAFDFREAELAAEALDVALNGRGLFCLLLYGGTLGAFDDIIICPFDIRGLLAGSCAEVKNAKKENFFARLFFMGASKK